MNSGIIINFRTLKLSNSFLNLNKRGTRKSFILSIL